MKKHKEIFLTERIVVIGIKESELKSFISKRNFSIHKIKNLQPFILEEYNSIHLVENKEENYKKDLISVINYLTQYLTIYFSIASLTVLKFLRSRSTMRITFIPLL